MFGGPLLGVGGEDLAVGRDLFIADPDRDLVAVGGLAGLADRHDETTPVGILGGKCRLHQRRVADGECNGLCRVVVGRAGDRDLHKLGGAFAVTNDLLGEVEQHRVECLLERRQLRIVRVGEFVIDLLASGEEQHRVARRRIGIDRDAVEAALDRRRETLLEQCRLDGQVGEDESEHRRHVGGDHAAALGDADDMAHTAVDPASRALGEGVGGADGIGRRRPCLRGGGADGTGEGRQARTKKIVGHRLPDHAGGGDEDLFRQHAELVGEGFDRDLNAGLPCRTREGVGVAGVAHDRTGSACARVEELLAPVDRRGRAQRPGEHPGHRRALGEFGDEEVVAALVAQAGRKGAERDPGKGRELWERLRSERRHGVGHCRSLRVHAGDREAGGFGQTEGEVGTLHRLPRRPLDEVVERGDHDQPAGALVDPAVMWQLFEPSVALVDGERSLTTTNGSSS